MQRAERSRTKTTPFMSSFPFHSQPFFTPLPTAPARGLAALAEAVDALFEPRRGAASADTFGAIPFGSCPTFGAAPSSPAPASSGARRGSLAASA